MKLAARIVAKVWGRRELPPPFTVKGEEPVGEIWFDPPPELSQLLVKYLFTSEKLSVQVHPSDANAPASARGKDECWLVLDAEPGATLGLGFKKEIGRDRMRAAALDGSIEDALEWHSAKAGDFFYVPAGTVHAIGPGLTLIEVQRNSDITYRLYDYGRSRELHLEQALAVATRAPYPRVRRQTIAEAASRTLVDGPYFRLSQCAGSPDAGMCALHGGPLLALPLHGEIAIEGERIAAGECGFAQDVGAVDFRRAGRTLLVSPV